MSRLSVFKLGKLNRGFDFGDPIRLFSRVRGSQTVEVRVQERPIFLDEVSRVRPHKVTDPFNKALTGTVGTTVRQAVM